jgi:ceramide glucosyltransferase
MLLMAIATGWMLIAVALFGACYAVTAAMMLGRARAASTTSAAALPPVTLLKPLHRHSPWLEESLSSFCRQDYPVPFQIVFGIHESDEGVIATVEKLKAEYPRLDIQLVIDPLRHGANPKISNVINMLPNAAHDILVLSDDDIAVPPDYLRSVVGVLGHEDVGAVTCFYAGRSIENFWSKLSAMGINYQFLPNAVLAVSLGLAAPCFGATIALRKSVLAAIGGLEAVRNHLADDYEIGRLVRACGLRVEVAPTPVSHICVEQSSVELFRHELRCARTIRKIDRSGHLGSVVTHALPLGLIGSELSGFSIDASASIVAILAARWFLKHRIDTVFGNSGVRPWLLPLSDIFSFAVFLCSFLGMRVDWRELRYDVNADGALAQR